MGGSKVRRVAVIGAGPSGLSAIHALTRENKFDVIRLFERRDRIGGTWIYDEKPDVFPKAGVINLSPTAAPAQVPGFASPAPEDTTSRTGTYDNLDSNVGSGVMEFTHTPFPKINSAITVERYGFNNPSRPWKVVAEYLEDLFEPFLHLLTFNTTLEKLVKEGDEWVLTLRQSGRKHRGQNVDYWWTERFDAVIIASGHYGVPYVPLIPGIEEFGRKFPRKLEHSKSFRDVNQYVGKRVIVVGGNVSASDLIIDLYKIVKGPLYLSQRGSNPKLENIWKLPNIQIVKTIKNFSLENGGTVEFDGGVKVTNIDKIIFATGYRLSYPFLQPNPVTEANRLSGFYQHVFHIGDPTLAVVEQVKAALSLRIYEYQAVAVARVLAGRGTLPSTQAQKEWEAKRLKYKGPTTLFHEIAPDFREYYDTLRAIAGSPQIGTGGYELPPYEDTWVDLGLAILDLKNKWVSGLIDNSDGKPEVLKAKL